MRSTLATLALAALSAGALAAPAPAPSQQPRPQSVPRGNVVPGVEVLLADSMHLLRGKRVGLITNHSGRDRRGTSTIDLLHRAGVRLTAIFAPEHGIRGTAAAGARIASTVDSATGVPVLSIYGETRVPTPEMLDRIDILLYDIQDVGARVYTYEWTMALSADAAGKAGKPFVVLDRPNPIRGDVIEGGVLDTAFRSFVGQYPVALRYGLTPGELLRYLVGTGQVRANVTVVPMKNYDLSMWWEDTGLPWTNPSPNLRDMEAVTLYPGTVFFEGTNLTEGRGTDMPFKVIGAPYLTDAGAVAAELNALGLPGVRFDSTSRTVEAGAAKYGGQTIPMLRLHVTDRDRLRPVDVGAHMLQVLYRRHRPHFQWRPSIERLSGSRELREAVEAGRVADLLRSWERETEQFRRDVAPYRLYPAGGVPVRKDPPR